MNQRIRELMIQAISDVDSIDDPETRRMYIPNCFAEKFAELIIGECVNNLEIHSTCFDGDVGRGVKTAARLTKEHFGVEE